MRRIVLFLSLFCMFAYGANLQLRPGQSKIFKTKETISTVFASDPNILDYKIVNPNTLAVYSKNDGYSEITVFGSDNETLLTISATVDGQTANLQRIAKLIEKQNPETSIKIEKLTVEANNGNNFGQRGYMISGTVPNEEVREKAYLTAATALGLSVKNDNIRRQQAVATSNTGTSLVSSGGNENLDFLKRNRVDGLIDAMTVIAPRQVNVKLIVADVEKGVIEKLGINYNEGGIFSIPLLTPAVSSLSRNIKTISINSVVEAINNEQIAKILATPNISVLSGESASFQVTSQFTPISTTVSNTGNPVSSPQTPVDYGVSLTVQPKVYSKDKIVLNVSQEVSNIIDRFEVNGASGANLKKRRTNSVIELADGDSFILGGLVDERDIEKVDSVPLLGDIPVVGALFRKTSITRAKSELVVVATVSLTEPTNGDYVEVPTFETKNVLASWLNLPNYVGRAEDKKEIMNFISNIGFIK